MAVMKILFKNKTQNFLFIFSCCILMFIPTTISFFNISQTKILCIFIGIAFMYTFVIKRNKIIQNIDIFVILTCIFSFINILILCFKVFSNNPIYFNEIFDSIRYLFFSMLYLIVCIHNEEKKNYVLLIKLLIICFFISAIIGITQYFNLFNLNELYIP